MIEIKIRPDHGAFVVRPIFIRLSFLKKTLYIIGLK